MLASIPFLCISITQRLFSSRSFIILPKILFNCLILSDVSKAKQILKFFFIIFFNLRGFCIQTKKKNCVLCRIFVFKKIKKNYFVPQFCIQKKFTLYSFYYFYYFFCLSSVSCFFIYLFINAPRHFLIIFC